MASGKKFPIAQPKLLNKSSTLLLWCGRRIGLCVRSVCETGIASGPIRACNSAFRFAILSKSFSASTRARKFVRGESNLRWHAFSVKPRRKSSRASSHSDSVAKFSRLGRFAAASLSSCWRRFSLARARDVSRRLSSCDRRAPFDCSDKVGSLNRFKMSARSAFSSAVYATAFSFQLTAGRIGSLPITKIVVCFEAYGCTFTRKVVRVWCGHAYSKRVPSA